MMMRYFIIGLGFSKSIENGEEDWIRLRGDYGTTGPRENQPGQSSNHHREIVNRHPLSLRLRP